MGNAARQSPGIAHAPGSIPRNNRGIMPTMSKQTFSSPRLRREAHTITAMLQLYCRDHHDGQGALCADCAQLQDYAHQRLARCPFDMHKPTCAKCTIHCYKPEMRARMRTVMRYAGPRMLLRHPYLALAHLADGLRKPPATPRKN